MHCDDENEMSFVKFSKCDKEFTCFTMKGNAKRKKNVKKAVKNTIEFSIKCVCWIFAFISTGKCEHFIFCKCEKNDWIRTSCWIKKIVGYVTFCGFLFQRINGDTVRNLWIFYAIVSINENQTKISQLIESNRFTDCHIRVDWINGHVDHMLYNVNTIMMYIVICIQGDFKWEGKE